MSEEEPANAPSCVLTAAFWGRPSDDLPGVDRRPIRGSPEGFHKRPGGLQGTPSSLHKTLGGLLWWQKDLKMFIVLPRTLVGLLGTPEGTSSWSGPRTSKGHRMAYRGLPVAFAKRYRCPSFVARRYQDVHWLSHDTGPFYENLQRTLDGLLGTPEGTPSKEHRRAFIRRRMAYKGRPVAFIRRYRCPSLVARRYQDVHWLSQDTGRSYGNLQKTLDGLLGRPKAFKRRWKAYKGRTVAFVRPCPVWLFFGREKTSGCSLFPPDSRRPSGNA